MKKLIGKQIENVYENLHNTNDLLIECTDKTIFHLETYVNGFYGFLNTKLEEMTQEQLEDWKESHQWRMWGNENACTH